MLPSTYQTLHNITRNNSITSVQVGGSWLSWWIVAAAAVSQIGQFEAEMSSDSFQLLGMAERGFLPAVLAKRSKHDTPTLGVILSSLGILTLVTFDFTQAGSSFLHPALQVDQPHGSGHLVLEVDHCDRHFVSVFLVPFRPRALYLVRPSQLYKNILAIAIVHSQRQPS